MDEGDSRVAGRYGQVFRGTDMKIGLIDVDGHNCPNIPLMKLSAWHKYKGDHVEFYEPLFSGHMDRVYMSKVFSFTKDYEWSIDADEIVRGGYGICDTACQRKRGIRQDKGRAAAGRDRAYLS